MAIPTNHIERKPNSRKYRVVDKGVTVEFLAVLINDPRWTVARICENYGLTPAEVYAAWSFYHDRQAEIDQTLADERQTTPITPEQSAAFERMQVHYEAKHGHRWQPPDVNEE
ncbi:MAG: DUF433 domain-containing protein [Armatimonadetes bacterium]|nr:DUF433 domain-containing protein [Anaerolineae bacterium]